MQALSTIVSLLVLAMSVSACAENAGTGEGYASEAVYKGGGIAVTEESALVSHMENTAGYAYSRVLNTLITPDVFDHFEDAGLHLGVKYDPAKELPVDGGNDTAMIGAIDILIEADGKRLSVVTWEDGSIMVYALEDADAETILRLLELDSLT
ncbi:MAG: hypothetical protein LBP30_07205 [Clostridiales Family XIII bacterium]|jgi:hypothetical protein|nr:hypothetical protein [Clostridiales Family XIII bacterium]